MGLPTASGVIIRLGQGAQVGGQVIRGGQGVGVVLAEDRTPQYGQTLRGANGTECATRGSARVFGCLGFIGRRAGWRRELDWLCGLGGQEPDG